MSNVDKPKILLVDDITENIKILIELLKADYNVFFAKNGELALDLAQKKLPDLILLDIMMPEMDGYEVCRRLKSNDITKNIPVIFLTAKSEVVDLVKGFELGAVDYITKPFLAAELKARIKTHIKLVTANKELIIKNVKLQQLSDLKNKFLGMASHDLKNPLTGILGSCELLLEIFDENLTDNQVELIQHISNLSQFMTVLLTDLLTISKIESGKLSLDKTDLNYIEVINNNIKLNTIIAHNKSISINIIVHEKIPNICIDKNKIDQVLNNLISNAIKYSHSNTKIQIEVSKDNDYVYTKVIDQGQGIPENEIQHIFKEFYKASVKPTDGETSTGLGLAIVKKIVESHNGSIWIKSEVGKGSEVTFALPIR